MTKELVGLKVSFTCQGTNIDTTTVELAKICEEVTAHSE